MSLDSSAFLRFRLTNFEGSASSNAAKGRPAHYRQNYTPDAMEAAVNSYLNPTAAARDYGVPRQTLTRHREQQQERADNRRYLQAEHEEQLVAWIVAAWKAGFPASDQCVIEKAVAMLDKLGERPTGKMRHWLEGFKQRHSDKLKKIGVQYRHKEAEQALSKESLDDFYGRLWYYIEKYSLTEREIWNMDETSCEMLGGKTKVWAPIHAKKAIMKATKDRQHMTICATVRADGFCIPPLSIVKGNWDTRAIVWRFEGSPEGTRVSFTRESDVVFVCVSS